MTKSTPINELPTNGIQINKSTLENNAQEMESNIKSPINFNTDDDDIERIIDGQNNQRNIDKLQTQIDFLKQELLKTNNLNNDNSTISNVYNSKDRTDVDIHENNSSTMYQGALGIVLNSLKSFEYQYFLIAFVVGVALYSSVVSDWLTIKLENYGLNTYITYVKSLLYAICLTLLKKI